MPIYEHICVTCGVFEFYRDMVDCGRVEACPSCHKPTSRVYSFQKPKEFQSYKDEKLGVVTSASQENKLRKKHGLIDGRDTPAYKKFEHKRKEYKWKKNKGLA